jgi:hypothetical protein
MERIREFDYGGPQNQSFFRMEIEFKIELIVGEGRQFSGRRAGAAARGVEADDFSHEDSIQGPVFPIAWKLSEGAGIDSFDKEPPSPAVAKEKAVGPSARKLERLCTQVLPGLIAEINVHFLNYSKIGISG